MLESAKLHRVKRFFFCWSGVPTGEIEPPIHDEVPTIDHDTPRLSDVKRNCTDARKAEKMLGWRAQMSIEQGIEESIDYFSNTPVRNTIEKNNG